MSRETTELVDMVVSSSNESVLLTLSRDIFKQSVSFKCTTNENPLPLNIIAGSIYEQSAYHAVVSLDLIDIKIGIIWGDQIWNFSPSRSLAADGCDILIFWNPGVPNPLEDELWWVRTYENVIPSLKIDFRDNTWHIVSAGPNGMPRCSVELGQDLHALLQLDLSETEYERRKRPYLIDRNVPI